MRSVTIRGCSLLHGHHYIRWTDGQGLDHTTSYELVLEHCDAGAYGLTGEDIEVIKMAMGSLAYL